jgi:hypothetical protein
MTNYNDGAITAIFVSQTTSPSVEDDAPNSPNPQGKFNVTLEMVAGNGLASGDYTVSITCADLSAVTQAPASLIPGALNGAGEFGSAAWTHVGNYWTFEKTETVNATAPKGGGGHVYQYTAALLSKSGEVVSIKRSDAFVLV